MALRQVKTLAAVMAAITMTAFAAVARTVQQDELKIAIREATDYLNGKIPKGNKIVILNVQSGAAELSDYIIDGLIANAVNDGFFTVVDRQQIDAIQTEQQFQMSGAVDDKDALDIGKFFGAQTIVSGAVRSIGKGYSLSIRALDIQTAQVQAQFNKDIASSEILNSLLGSNSGAISQQQAAVQPQQQYQPVQESDGKPRSLKKRRSLEIGGTLVPYGYNEYYYYDTYYGDDNRSSGGPGIGGYLRVNLKYFEIVGDLAAYGGDVTGMCGVLGKIPIGNDYIKVTPVFGFGVGSAGAPLAVGGKIDIGVTEIVYLRSEYLYFFGSDNGMSFKIGGGLDIGLGERKRAYIRPELMWNFEEGYEWKSNRFDLRCGIGYKWGGQKRVKEW